MCECPLWLLQFKGVLTRVVHQLSLWCYWKVVTSEHLSHQRATKWQCSSDFQRGHFSRCFNQELLNYLSNYRQSGASINTILRLDCLPSS